MPFAVDEDFALAILGCIGVVLLAVLLVAVFFHVTLMKALRACAPRNRAMAPGLVWLNFIPFWNVIWQFVTVIQVGNSLRAEYDERGMRSRGESFGKTLGLTVIVLGMFVAVVNYGGQAMARGDGGQGVPLLFSGVLVVLCLLLVILWVVYWVKIAGFTKQLNQSSRRSKLDGVNARTRQPQPADTRTDVTCPACAANVNIWESKLGQDLWCPMCTKVFTAVRDQPPVVSGADQRADTTDSPHEPD